MKIKKVKNTNIEILSIRIEELITSTSERMSLFFVSLVVLFILVAGVIVTIVIA